MPTTCVVCNILSSGMISIFEHPNNLDYMLNFVSGHQTQQDDYLCITCYDDLKTAFNFKQKCHQSKLYRPEVLKSSGEVADFVEDDDDTTKQDEITSSSNLPEIKMEHQTELGVDFKILTEIADSKQNDGDNMDDCLDYFMSEKSIENQELDDEDEPNDETDEGKYIVQILESEDSSEVREQLEEEGEDAEESEQQEATIRCEICDKTFTKTGSYRMHMHRMHSVAERRERMPRDRHRRGPVPKYHEHDIFKNLKETQCEFCYKVFSSPEVLQDHEKHHKKEERPYRCNNSECTARFKDRYSVRCHIITHTGEKRYKCRYCDKRFHQSGNAKAHERYHTGEKPYMCPHCGKGFAENGNLKAHIRFHTGERPYECPYCSKTFRTHYSHKIHVRSHTQEKPFECGECGKSFNCSGKLKIHERIHTGVRPFKCQMCSAAFMDSSRLKRHSKTHPDYTPFADENGYKSSSQQDRQ